MKNLFFIALLIALTTAYFQEYAHADPVIISGGQSAEIVLQEAYKNKQSDFQVQGKGVVVKILPDDRKGSRHQRFIVKLRTGQTLLVAHNIDLAPRIQNLRVGDTVEFFGEYKWNPKGGVIHWTHHDPDDRHIGGWLKHEDRTYK